MNKVGNSIVIAATAIGLSACVTTKTIEQSQIDVSNILGSENVVPINQVRLEYQELGDPEQKRIKRRFFNDHTGECKLKALVESGQDCPIPDKENKSSYRAYIYQDNKELDELCILGETWNTETDKCIDKRSKNVGQEITKQ